MGEFTWILERSRYVGFPSPCLWNYCNDFLTWFLFSNFFSWACGVIMFTLLVGCPPFWHRKQMVMLRNIMEGKYSFTSPEWADISGKWNCKNPIQIEIVPFWTFHFNFWLWFSCSIRGPERSHSKMFGCWTRKENHCQRGFGTSILHNHGKR